MEISPPPPPLWCFWWILCVFSPDEPVNVNKLYQSALVTEEYLHDSNKYWCEQCLRYNEAKRCVKFETLPKLLTLQIKRFSSGYGWVYFPVMLGDAKLLSISVRMVGRAPTSSIWFSALENFFFDAKHWFVHQMRRRNMSSFLWNKFLRSFEISDVLRWFFSYQDKYNQIDSTVLILTGVGCRSVVSKVNEHMPTPLVLSCFCEECQAKQNANPGWVNPEHQYYLYGVIMHLGATMASGHYVAYVKARDPSADYESCTRERRKTASLSMSLSNSTSSSNNDKSNKKKAWFFRSSKNESFTEPRGQYFRWVPSNKFCFSLVIFTVQAPLNHPI